MFCGEQSQGKSSLIELITGKELPRGQGTQTRVPCMFKMRRGPESMKAYYMDKHQNKRIT